MKSDRELMQQALDAFESGRAADRAEAMTALRAALQKPTNSLDTRYFTVVYKDIAPGDEARSLGEHPKMVAMSWSHALHDRDAALITPPRREWVGLTDDERLEVAGIDGSDEWFWKVVEAIEAKLKEKNT
jgi:hypothetical protein